MDDIGKRIFLVLALLAKLGLSQLATMRPEHDAESWMQTVDQLLDSQPANRVHFYLFTRDRGSEPITSEVTDRKLFNGTFTSHKPTKVLIPGFRDTPLNSAFANNTRKVYLNVYDCQVITVFWDAATANYTEARSNVTNVATAVAQFLTRLMSEEGLHLGTTPLVGHGMGAQIAGTTGKMLNRQLGTVIGLDPANPTFVPGSYNTISTESAQFVQIIHASRTAEGIAQAVGHVDFFVNGEFPPQPGCEDLPGFSWTICSHERAPMFFSESIMNPTAFPASKCSSYARFRAGECDGNQTVYMGHNTTTSARGTYYLRTRNSSPFSLGAEGSTGQGYVPELGPLNSTEEHSVHFWLVNRVTRSDPIRSNITDERLFGGAYNSQKPTIVLVVGYGHEPGISLFAEELTEAFLTRADYELIVVYWILAAPTVDFRIAVGDIVNIARVISQFLGRMQNEENLDLSSLTLIGHSAGGPIAGTAGRFVKGEIQTFVGSDPLGLLVNAGGGNMIDRNSAKFVMVIHTDVTGLGILEPVGHVDFYVNNGVPPQPGCEGSDTIYPISLDATVCSHVRAYHLFAESINNPTAFPATNCSSYLEATEGQCHGPSDVFLGLNTSRSARGIYHVRTRSSSPYGLGYPKTN